MDVPNLNEEVKLWKKGYAVMGIDEVGRGAFAGPLFVGGVIFPPTTNNPSTSLRASERIKYLESLGINDSKKLKPGERKILSKIIQNESLASHISAVDVNTINRIGIGKATLMAMRDAVKILREILKERGVTWSGGPPTSARSEHAFARTSDGGAERQDPEQVFVLVDGFYVKYLNGIGLKNQRGIVRGDNISLSIAAASIIAKVARDNHMRRLSAKFPVYGWGRNKGYGTNFHLSALQKFGPTRLHRTTFIENYI